MSESNGSNKKTIEVMLPMKGNGRNNDTLPEERLPYMPLGSTYFGRIKWNSTKKFISAYRGMVEELEATERSLGRLDDARRERQEAKERLADSKRIHATAAMQRELAYEQAQEDLEEAKFKREINAHHRERRRRELLQDKELVEPQKPWEKVVLKVKELMENEREMRECFAKIKAEEIRKVDGEEKLSDGQRKMLADLEMHIGNEMLKMRTGQG